MALQCHNNTCPVGIATQRADLRAKFPGKAEMVIEFLTHVAEEVRGTLADLGAASLDEVIGHTELLEQDAEDRQSGTSSIFDSRGDAGHGQCAAQHRCPQHRRPAR